MKFENGKTALAHRAAFHYNANIDISKIKIYYTYNKIFLYCIERGSIYRGQRGREK